MWRLVRDVRTVKNHKGALYKHLHVEKRIDLLAQPQKIFIGRQISTQHRKQFLTELSSNRIDSLLK